MSTAKATDLPWSSSRSYPASARRPCAWQTISRTAAFRVVLPHLFGPLGRTSMLGNMVRVMCMRREFKLFEKNGTSPVVDWLRALCNDLCQLHGLRGVGVIGMCLTGNFAISMMADDRVLAGVASQPSMPLLDQKQPAYVGG